MNTTQQHELRWEHQVTLEMAHLAWPIGLSMISYATATLIDTLFVSPLGADALAGVSLGGVIAFTCISFALGALRGVKITASHAVGAASLSRAVAVRRAGVRLGLILGGLTALGAYLVSFALAGLAKSPEAGDAASAYLSIRALGMPMVLFYAALREYRQALGDTMRPMIAVVIGNVLNIALDYTFIILCGWGVEGAAWATTFAHFVEAFLILALVRGSHRAEDERAEAEIATHGVTPDAVPFDATGEVWRMGWPLGVQFVLESSSFSLLALLLAGLDSIHLAAHQIVLQVIHLTFLPLVAVSDAASVMAGQALGANRRHLVRRVARSALAMGLGYASFCTVMLVIGNEHLVALFTSDASLGALVGRVFWIAAAFQLLDAVDITTRGILRGVGDVRFSALIGIACAWLILPPGTYFFGYVLGWGVIGAWTALAINILLSAAIMRWRLQSDRWQQTPEPNEMDLDLQREVSRAAGLKPRHRARRWRA